MRDREVSSSETRRPGAVVAFLDRVGGMIIAPRETLARYTAESPGGFNDLLLLLLFPATALQLPTLGRGAWTLVDISVVTGVLTMLRTLTQRMIVPLIAVIIGSVLLKALSPREVESRSLDLAALCALPAAAFQIAMSLLGMFFPDLVRSPGPQVILGVSALWFAVLLLVARGVLFDKVRKTSRR